MNSIQIEAETLAPGKIVCVGRNYLEHIRELGNETPATMVIFNKPNSAISARLRTFIEEPLHYEGEICFLVRDGTLHAVGFGLDLTRRKLQSQLKAKGLPWERAKAFDGAACFSNFVKLDKIELSTLSLELKINGELRQQGGFDLMIHKPEEILADIQQFMSLHDNDIIMTGTPKGVGQIQLGDRFNGCVKSDQQVLTQQTWVAE